MMCNERQSNKIEHGLREIWSIEKSILCEAKKHMWEMANCDACILQCSRQKQDDARQRALFCFSSAPNSAHLTASSAQLSVEMLDTLNLALMSRHFPSYVVVRHVNMPLQSKTVLIGLWT